MTKPTMAQIEGLTTEIAKIATLETDVAALKPGALQTVSNVSEIVIDLTPYKNVDGLCDIDVVLNDLEPTTVQGVYAQVSTDGGGFVPCFVI